MANPTSGVENVANLGPGFDVEAFSIIDEALGVAYTVDYVTKAHLIVPTQGTLSARLKVSLPANAVVDALEIVVTARRADEAVASEVAELRGTGLGNKQQEIVVDFGTVRTVAAVRFGISAFIHRVDAWNGTEFPTNTFDAPYTDFSVLPAGSIPNSSFARFTSERRTERLRITVSSQSSAAALMEALSLVLPDSPKDLTITINGGAPVWSLPGPAAKGTASALSADAWNSSNQRLADLTGAFRALTGDPLDGAEREHELLLTSREAGVLGIAEHRREIRRIRRATFGGAATTTLAPESEGVTEVPLSAPGTPVDAVADQVAFTLSGDFGPERRIPATGPDATPGLDDPSAPLVSLDMTSERAVLLRLPVTEGLPSARGLRLPLVPGSEGAEVRLAPWSNAGPGRTQPEEALPKLIGDPVVLEPGGALWQSFLFGDTLEVDPLDAPWIAVLVTRGAASVGLSAAGGGSVRVGPPSGPWRLLPALFSTGAFQPLRFPCRVIGDAPDTAVPAPLVVGATGAPAPLPIDPAPRGSRFTLAGLATSAPQLSITHFAGGEIRLADIDIIFDR